MHTRRSTLVIAALALAFALLFGAAPTYAAFTDKATGTSLSNPGTGSGATWRYQWGNTLYPDIEFDTVPEDAAMNHETLGFFYEFHQLLGPLTVPVPGVSPMSPTPSKATSSGKFDIPAILNREGWVAQTGTTQRGEGLYYITALFYNQFAAQPTSSMTAGWIGVDLTNPSPVQDLTATVTGLQTAGLWTEARSRKVAWTPQAYDGLSGVGGFNVSVNSSNTIFVQNVAPDPAYEPYASVENTAPAVLPQVSYVNIEDLAGGKSTIAVQVVDRATNISTWNSVTAYVDWDTPGASWVSPSSSVIPAAPKLSVNASDSAGITSVKFYLDSTSTYLGTSTSTKSPYALTPNLAGYSNGAHKLICVVADQIGTAPGSWLNAHTRTITKSVTLDRTPPSLSVSSAGPNPFYPRYRDGYKDNFVVNFSTGEKSTAYLYIYNSSGKVYQTIKKSISSGSNSLVWNGKSSGGAMNSGTFKAQVKLVDAAGNATTSGKYTATISFYQLVKTGSGSVKVVPR